MRKPLLILLLMLFSLPVQAGIRVGPYIGAGVISYDDINAETLERESRNAPIGFVGANMVQPFQSGIFLSTRVGFGFTQRFEQSTPLPPGSTGGMIKVRSELQIVRAALDINTLVGQSTFLYAGGGVDMTRLRFTGDIADVNADSNDPFFEAGLGYMINDDQFIRLSGSYNTGVSMTTVSLSYTLFLFSTGY